jgi:protein O-GlcNAc transferase
MQPLTLQSQQILSRAVAAHQAGNFAEAELLYKIVLQANKKQFDALHMLGVIEGQRGNFAEGARRLKEALRIKPNSADALINLGRMQGGLDMYTEAAASYKKALTLDPRSPLAHSNMGIVLRQLKRYDEALTHCDKALALAPDYADAWTNRGNVLFDLDRFDEAMADYGKAIASPSAQPRAHLGRGNVLVEFRRYADALGAYDRALASSPDLAEAWFGRGIALTSLQRYEDAFKSRDRAFTLNPNLKYAEGSRLFSKLQICDWTNLDAEVARLSAGLSERKLSSLPFMILPLPLSPQDQLQYTAAYVRELPSFPRTWRNEIYPHDRIRIAYASSDLREHPVGHLTAGLFEHHDRSRFEITAIYLGPEEDSPIQRRIKDGFEKFIDCRTQNDQAVADLIRELEIDILVDLNGYTHDSRRGIFARRPAPVQVNYLGYPGSMGANYYQYIVADRTIIPPEHFEFYSEKVAWLPESFLVTDDRSAPSSHTPSRGELQLPEAGFVFSCFNQSIKLWPPMFALWMRLLHAVKGSVLWLLESNQQMAANLRRAAENCGIDPVRIVFAPRIPFAMHLARQRLAGLFLDTTPYNAGATAAAALWSGLPVLTVLGDTFVGRMAASILYAAGLPELVTDSLADYEALAIKIATEPALCAALKDNLVRNRDIQPLFDTTRFTRNLESAYTTMWQTYQHGRPPESFAAGGA